LLAEPFHGDPADRLLVATARTLPATLITRDAKILSYSEAGHLRALAC
jgi:PIN domain nuclease of toxin-antitoxin system